MATYTDRITLVFPIAAKNRQAAASLQTLEITESGNEFEKLVPLNPAQVSQYASAFNLPLLAEVETLKANLAAKATELATATQANTSLEAQVATLTEQLSTATTQLSSATTQLSTLTQKVTDLEQYRPYNPRWLDGRSFYKRISQEDMETLLASDNPQLVIVGKTILAYRDNHVQWPVILDSTDFTNLVGYVMQSGVFDAHEVTEIMRDASREEAYRVPQ